MAKGKVIAQPAKRTAPIARTSAGLRAALFDVMEDLRRGRVNASIANATARLADSIINTVEIEIDVQRLLRSTGREINASDDGPAVPVLRLS